jgi:hypothetical protein
MVNFINGCFLIDFITNWKNLQIWLHKLEVSRHGRNLVTIVVLKYIYAKMNPFNWESLFFFFFSIILKIQRHAWAYCPGN